MGGGGRGEGVGGVLVGRGAWVRRDVVWATVASLSLRRRARTAGVAVTAEKGHEEIWFRRRPGRHGHTVWGCSRPRAGVVLELWSPGERCARERACRAGELGVGAVVP